MKIDRLIGILSVLLQQEMITAPELAEKFEVSRRTINRDIEALCKAIFHGQNAADFQRYADDHGGAAKPRQCKRQSLLWTTYGKN